MKDILGAFKEVKVKIIVFLGMDPHRSTNSVMQLDGEAGCMYEAVPASQKAEQPGDGLRNTLIQILSLFLRSPPG